MTLSGNAFVTHPKNVTGIPLAGLRRYISGGNCTVGHWRASARRPVATLETPVRRTGNPPPVCMYAFPVTNQELEDAELTNGLLVGATQVGQLVWDVLISQDAYVNDNPLDDNMGFGRDARTGLSAVAVRGLQEFPTFTGTTSAFDTLSRTIVAGVLHGTSASDGFLRAARLGPGAMAALDTVTNQTALAHG